MTDRIRQTEETEGARPEIAPTPWEAVRAIVAHPSQGVDFDVVLDAEGELIAEIEDMAEPGLRANHARLFSLAPEFLGGVRALERALVETPSDIDLPHDLRKAIVGLVEVVDRFDRGEV